MPYFVSEDDFHTFAQPKHDNGQSASKIGVLCKDVFHEVENRVELDPVGAEAEVEGNEEPGVLLSDSLLMRAVVLEILAAIYIYERNDDVIEEEVGCLSSQPEETERVEEEEKAWEHVAYQLKPLELELDLSLFLLSHSDYNNI